LGVLHEVNVLILPPAGGEGTEGVIVVVAIEREKVIGVGECIGIPVDRGGIMKK